jgi:Mce-associated membrane protein
MTAAARAAAKRARRPEHPEHGRTTVWSPADEAPPLRTEEPGSGRTVLVDAPDGAWDDPPEPSPEAAEEEPRESTRVRRFPRGRLLTAASAVLLVAGLVAAAVLGWQYREGQRADRARGEALDAARKAAPVVLSYDYRRLDRDFARARTHLTGDFRDEYGRTTKTVVGPTARKYHGVVKATVVEPAGGGAPAASVVSASPDRAVVLLFVNQVTRSTQVTGSRVDLNRVRMTLTRAAGGWKVSGVDAL